MNKGFIVIDDAAFLREVIKNILLEKGMRFLGEAGDGEAGVQLVLTTLPDLVVIDMVMPKKNGIQAIQEIKSQNSDIKILVCSTLDDELLIQQAKEAGADEYLMKPFSKNQIYESLSRMFLDLGDLNERI
ncbi:chemotaxis response regulator [Bdellovibrio bacteriovorus W]|nr:chemotaxis response regulator [Bdellovibrio bacteriovorus W]